MKKDTYEREMDFKGLLFANLYRWRLLLVAAVIMAALLGGYKFLSTDSEAEEKSPLLEYSEEEALAEYEEQKANLELTIERLTLAIEGQQEYLDRSILMQIDPYGKFTSYVELLVETSDVRKQSMGTLLRAYEWALNDGKYMENLAEKMGSGRKYIREIAGVYGNVGMGANEGSGEVLLEVTDDLNGKGLLRIWVHGPTKKFAETVSSEILKQVESLQEKFSEEIGLHSIQVLRRGTIETLDMGLFDTQQSQINKLNDLKKTLKDQENALEGLEVEEPPVSETDGYTVKNGIKYAIIGFLAGGVLAVWGVSVLYIMGDKVTSEREVLFRYRLKNLGTFSKVYKKKPLDFIDSWLRRLAGEGKEWPEDAVLEMIATNVENYAGEKKALFITGLASQELLDKIQNALGKSLTGVTFTAERDIVNHASARKKMAECEAVILVEEREVSRYSMIQQELELIGNVGKEVVGVIVG